MARLIIALLLLMTVRTAALAAENISARAHYECIWWSTEQMANFDPNHPPPRKTRVRLDRWEYSDPVGVPHPDTVTLVVMLTSSGVQKNLDIVVRTQWLGGRPAKAEALTSHIVSLEAGVPKIIEFQLPVKATIDQNHPKLLRSSIWAGAKELSHADLPITVGD